MQTFEKMMPYDRDVPIGDDLILKLARAGSKVRVTITQGDGCAARLKRRRKVRVHRKRRSSLDESGEPGQE